MEKNMTVGNPMKLILVFSIPILLGMMLQQFYNLADTVIVGQRLGKDALAAVGATTSLVSLIFSFVFGLTGGFAIIIAQYYGAKQNKEMRKAIAATITMSIIFTIVIMVASLIWIEDILFILNIPEDIIADSIVYIRIFLFGLFSTMVYNVCCNLLRAIGNSVAPLVFLAISTVLNVGLDLLFVYPLNWGIAGAAVATVIAQTVSAVVSLIYIIKKAPTLHVTKTDFVYDIKLIIKLLTTGFSMAMMFSIVGIGSVILQSGINDLGKETLAAHTAGRKILEVVMNPMAAIGNATATFASQNFGAGLMKRVKKGSWSGILMTAIWSTFITIAVYLFAPQMVHLILKPEEINLTDTAVMYLKISVPFFYSLGVLVVLRNVLQGIGKRIIPILASTIEMVGKIVVIIWLVPQIGYLGICVAEPIIWVIDGVLVLIVFLFVKSTDRASLESNEELNSI